MKLLRGWFVLGWLGLAILPPDARAATPFLPGARRVVFTGDSITYDGRYVTWFETFVRTRFPERRMEILNLGLPSETVSGLSEEGHAGGQFPRPCLCERAERLLAETKPDLLVACYGMNDGIYLPLDEARLKSFQNGLQRLRDNAQKVGAQVLHLTPPTFDFQPLRGHAGNMFEGYNGVLDEYSRWLLSRQNDRWRVIDVHGPMGAYLASRRKDEPKFILAGDGVHAGALGHWLITEQLLTGLGLPPDVDSLELDLAKVNTKDGPLLRGRIEGANYSEGRYEVHWRSAIPASLDPGIEARPADLEQIRERFNRHRLTIRNAPAARYEIMEGSTRVGGASREELAGGLDLSRFPALSIHARAAEVLKLTGERQAVLKDAWLTHVGHHRPGMAKGLPLPEAEAKAKALDEKLRELAKPMLLNLTVRAVKE